MNAWWETAGILLLMIIGILGSLGLAKCPKPYWITDYCLCMVSALAFVLERHVAGLEFVRPFSWIAAGRVRYTMAAVLIPLLLVPLASQVRQRRLQYLLRIFGVLMLFHYSLSPFLAPALARNKLLALKTTVDADGICLQQTGYTCGPASAVTALRKLGLSAEEGEVSVWARTSTAGTMTDLLTDALQTHYGDQGLTARWQNFKSVPELGQTLPVLAMVKYEFLIDHFITVLKVTDNQVIVGDPLTGKTSYTYQSFAEIWRYSGIVLQRNGAKR